jgi:hypothetical protein
MQTLACEVGWSHPLVVQGGDALKPAAGVQKNKTEEYADTNIEYRSRNEVCPLRMYEAADANR